MRTILLAAGASLVLSTAAEAQQAAPAAAPACYIEIHRLMAEPPEGIGELGTAIRELDTRLRPQVEEVTLLKAQIARLERQAEASSTAPGVEQVSFGLDEPRQALPTVGNAGAEEIQRLQMQLGIKQDQLKLDYATQQQALVGPVQARISRGAQAFAATNPGCSGVKMARAADLAGLAGTGARNVTGDFVAWYQANPPG
jgi:Skp family chaperone for outer membrane proteins